MSRKNITTVKLNLEKETKGAVRYHEINADGEFITDFRAGAVGTLYIRKDVFSDENYPKQIELSIR